MLVLGRGQLSRREHTEQLAHFSEYTFHFNRPLLDINLPKFAPDVPVFRNPNPAATGNRYSFQRTGVHTAFASEYTYLKKPF